MAAVRGYCPMGCGETLVLAGFGDVTCGRAHCPNPQAVDQILADPETEHLIDFKDRGFSILHPLRERLDDDQGGLWGCAFHQHIEALDGPPVRPGRYRATPSPRSGFWNYTRIDG